MDSQFTKNALRRAGAQNPENQSFCHHQDQINESFCDWLSVEVLARYMQRNLKSASREQHIDGIASIHRNACHDEYGLSESRKGKESEFSHPASGDRLRYILLAHPAIRRFLGCTPISVNISNIHTN